MSSPLASRCYAARMGEAAEPSRGRTIGRYVLYGEIAAGGMATVHLGRLVAAAGFSRMVAIKKLHAQFAKNPDFVTMFLDEARLAARIRHPNVVPTLDVVATQDELLLVMEYVQGESLSRLLRRVAANDERVNPKIVASIMAGALHGLHAAHEAKSERGEPLDIVHRDVSPQNILVGHDGVARVLDFGVAKALGRHQVTREGHVKGKLAYMAPEQIRGTVTRKTDVFAAGIVLWEALTARNLFVGDNDGALIDAINSASIDPPSAHAPGLSSSVDAVTMRALERDPDKRFATAREMAIALEACEGVALASEVGAWVERMAGESLAKQHELISEIESSPARLSAPPSDRIAPPSATTAPVRTKVVEPAVPSLPKRESTMESAATSTPAERPVNEPRSRTRFVVSIAAAIALIAATIYIVRATQKPTTIATTTATPSTIVSAPLPSASSPAPLPSTAPSPIVSASVSASAPAIKTVPKPTAPATTMTTSKPVLPGCDPPYSIDSAGHKHFRPECMP